MVAGVFGLREVRTEQLDTTWEESANYGYFGGGLSPSYVNTIDRIDFSNETVSAPGNNLTEARSRLAAVSNSNYGYFGGGDSPPYVCTIDRLDFSNETVSAPGTNLTQARGGLTGVSNSNYGYFGGGFLTPPVSYYSTIDRLDFSTETVTGPPIHGINLTQARSGLAGVSNSNYGYFGGGYSSPPAVFYCNIDRLDFSTETVTGPPIHGINLTEARSSLVAVSNSNYGYFGGGSTAPTTFVCTIDRLDFSNETVSAPGKNLTEVRSRLAAVSNSNYGYFGGGSTPTQVSIIDRLDFSNETVTTPAPKLTQARGFLASVSGGTRINARKVRTGITTDNVPISSTYGYFAGGFVPPRVSTIDRLEYSTETIQNPVINAKLTGTRYDFKTVSNSNYGYFGGGDAPPYVSTIDRLDFSNETIISPGNYTLSENKSGSMGVSNSNYGYFGGGRPGPIPRSCIIDRLDFSNETVSSPGNNLFTVAHAGGAISNSNYGYFAGGENPRISTISRLDFTTETVSLPGKNLKETKTFLDAVSNSNYGYFGGGQTVGYISCSIDRLDFSTENVDGPPTHGMTLSSPRYFVSAVSNSNYGYFAGGTTPPASSTIDRLDFTTETVTTPAPTLTQARYGLAGVSN